VKGHGASVELDDQTFERQQTKPSRDDDRIDGLVQPQYRREHTPEEVAAWYGKRGYHSMRVTTHDLFGFNMIGIKSPAPTSGSA
jgi:hypothetical protein